METICSVHEKIKDIADKRFSNSRNFDKLEIDEYKDIIYDLEGLLNNIYDLADEAKELGQKMEDGLRNRKDYMIMKGIEEEYQSN